MIEECHCDNCPLGHPCDMVSDPDTSVEVPCKFTPEIMCPWNRSCQSKDGCCNLWDTNKVNPHPIEGNGLWQSGLVNKKRRLMYENSKRTI